MRLLMITYYYAPMNEIGAVRTSKLAKYFIAMGWKVDVMTIKPNPRLQSESIVDETLLCHELKQVNTYRADFPKELEFLYRFKSTTSKDFAKSSLGEEKHLSLSSIKGNVKADLAFYAQNYFIGRAFIREAKQLNSDYDVIISSFGPYSMIDAGLKIKRIYKRAIYCQDVRDYIIRPGETDTVLQKQYKKKCEQAVEKEADIICVVSKDAIPNLGKRKVLEIPNGFDEDELFNQKEGLNNIKWEYSDFFNIFYGGRLYPDQDLTKLARIISRYEHRDMIRIHYAGAHFEQFVSAFEDYNLTNIVVNHGLLSRNETMKLQRKADANLQLSWENKNQHGIVTGKIYELIIARKPIISIINGERTDCKIGQMFGDDPIRQCFFTSDQDEDILSFINFIYENRIIDSIENTYQRYKKYSYREITKKLIYAITRKKD